MTKPTPLTEVQIRRIKECHSDGVETRDIAERFAIPMYRVYEVLGIRPRLQAKGRTK